MGPHNILLNEGFFLEPILKPTLSVAIKPPGLSRLGTVSKNIPSSHLQKHYSEGLEYAPPEANQDYSEEMDKIIKIDPIKWQGLTHKTF